MTFEEWCERYNGGILLDDTLTASAMRSAAQDAWQAAQPQWQPISTAPEDILEYELDILVIERKGLPCMASYCNSERKWFASTTVALLNPTHWMPLPAITTRKIQITKKTASALDSMSTKALSLC